MLLQVFRKEVGEFAEGDKACPVIQIHMPGSGDDIQFLRFRREPVRVFAELDGVRLFARDEQHGARGNRLDVRERVEVHELDVAGERRVRGELRGGAFRSEFPSRRPVECVEFPLDGRGRFRQFMDGAAGVPGFAAREFRIALFRRFPEDLLSLLQGHAMPESVPVGRAHVVHADCRYGLQAGIDLGGADGETAAAADADDPDPFTVHKRVRAEEVRGGAEGFGIQVR